MFLLNYFLHRTRLSLKLMEDMSPVDLQKRKKEEKKRGNPWFADQTNFNPKHYR